MALFNNEMCIFIPKLLFLNIKFNKLKYKKHKRFIYILIKIFKIILFQILI